MNKIGHYVLSKKGFEFSMNSKNPKVKEECINGNRKIGEPLKGYEESVPESWVENGFVELR